MTRRGLYANTGRPPGPPPRAELDRARILSELERIQVQHSKPAPGGDAEGQDRRTDRWAGTEGAAVEIARRAIRRGELPPPGVRFVARRRGCSAVELMRACGGLEYQAGRYTVELAPEWILAGAMLDAGGSVFSPARRQYTADERYFERQAAQDGHP